jgi:hypothetical protein
MPRQRWATSELRDAALGYATRQRWTVAPGHYVAGTSCSCGEGGCETPGAHPLARYWPGGATDRTETIQSWWRRAPHSVVLPTGRHFDVLEIPRVAGSEALMRLEILDYQLGPVAQSANGRILIWVTPESRAVAPLGGWERLERLGIRCHGYGDYVLAPPSQAGRWLCPPESTGRYLPRAMDLLGTLACACRQTLLAAARPELVPAQRRGNHLEERLA